GGDPLRPRPRPPGADRPPTAGRGRALAAPHHAPHRLRRLVDGRLRARARGPLRGSLGRAAVAPPRAGPPVRRLRALAARELRTGGARGAARLLAGGTPRGT